MRNRLKDEGWATRPGFKISARTNPLKFIPASAPTVSHERERGG